MDTTSEEIVEVVDQTAIHKCNKCGGNMEFSPSLQKLKCNYCGNEIAFDAEENKIVENDLLSTLENGSIKWEDTGDFTIVTCENCGASMQYDRTVKSDFCMYCGSSLIVNSDIEDIIKPAYVIPFNISEQRANELFRQWIKGRLFAPNALRHNSDKNQILGTYIPYWTFDSQVYARYSARRGDYYYVTKTRVVNGKRQTYQERRTRWRRVNGTFDRFYDDILITASNRIDTHMLMKIDNYNMHGLKLYDSKYLSGFLAERYSVDLEEGWSFGKDRLTEYVRQDIISKIGGDVVENLNIDSNYRDLTFKHILLPIWLSSYNYNGEIYNFMVNGQSGQITGVYPKSPIKIALTVLLLIIIGFLIYYFSNYQ